MRKFDYSFLNNGFLPASLVNLTSSIAALRTMAGVRREEYLRVFSELEAVAKIQSVKSSNAIEGIVTSDARIAEIVNQNSAPLNHSEREIAGYRDALNEIHLNYDYIDFRESDILHLHEIMMSMAGYEFAGRYKTSDNYILEEDAQGNRRIRFRPTPAAETKQLWSSWNWPIWPRGTMETSTSFFSSPASFWTFFVYTPSGTATAGCPDCFPCSCCTKAVTT